MTSTVQFPSSEVTALLEKSRFGQIIEAELAPGSGETFVVANPSTGEPIVELGLGTADDVDRAVTSARRALSSWRSRTPGERAETLLAIAELIDSNAELFAELESLNVGKPVSVSREEPSVMSDCFRFMAGAIRTAQAPAPGEYVPGSLSLLRREPIGLVAAITPWNYPLTSATWKIAPALAAGNTIVVKPSELTPLTTIVFVDMVQSLLPPGVLNLVLGTGSEVGERLSSHPDVDMLSLTGSVASGVAVSRGGAENLKRIHLELGGKAPVVVFNDADIDGAADAIRTLGFWNSGQECGAATRVLVGSGIHDQLVTKLRDAIGSLRVGRPDEGEEVEMGPLISEGQRQRVDALVQEAVAAGATVELGGGPSDLPGYFYEPTLLTRIAEGSEILRAEIFGPVVTVESFEGEADAISRANDSRYGLAASVWTESSRRGIRVANALEYGTVWVNSHLVVPTEMPWGGFGVSGGGREQSTYAIDEFSRTKHVVMASE